ncbi:uncharacterized protein [Amphiura filiformis]|uniref:uncharacterized protein n=1 Tax=Amphiura filiformis TaxID=82378 RepID=UPI003B20C0AF
MANYNYGFSGSSRGLGSSTIPSLVGSTGSSGSYGLGGSSSSFASRNVSSSQLEDAAFAARVLGLSGNLTGSSTSSTRVGSSYGTGLLPEPQQIRSLGSDVQASSTSYGSLGGQGRGSGYSGDLSSSGNYSRDLSSTGNYSSSSGNYSSGTGGRYDNEPKSYSSSTYEQDRARLDSRDDLGYRSSTQTSDIYDSVYGRQSGSGGGGGSNNRDSNRSAANQNQQQQRNQSQQQQRNQNQQQRNQQQRNQNQRQDPVQLQAQLQTQVQLQETLKRVQQLEEDQHKKNRKMEEMEMLLQKRKMEDEMMARKRKMEDDLTRMAMKQPRLDFPQQSLLPTPGPLLDTSGGSFYNSPSPRGYGSSRYPTEPRPSMRSPGGRIQPLMGMGGMGRNDSRKRPLSGSTPGRNNTALDRKRERNRQRQRTGSQGGQQQQRGQQQQPGKRPQQQSKPNQGQQQQQKGQTPQKKGNQQQQQRKGNEPQQNRQGGQQQRRGRQQPGAQPMQGALPGKSQGKVHYHPELVKKFGFNQVRIAYDKEISRVKTSLLKLEKPEPAKDRDGNSVCFGCGKEGHKISKCDDPNSKEKGTGRDNSATTVSHQVKLLTDMNYGLHIQDKKLYNLKCYVCNFKCPDMEQYYQHLENKQHLTTVDKVKGKVGDPGRLGLAIKLAGLPNIKGTDKNDEAGNYSYLCRICLEAVPGPAATHEESPLHKWKKTYTERCLPCRLHFTGKKALHEHQKSHLHGLMAAENRKNQQAEKTTPSKDASTKPKPQAAKTQTGIPAGAIMGVEFVVPVSGWFCKVCQKFYTNVSKNLHCAESNHHKKLWDWCKKKNMTLEDVLKTYTVKNEASDSGESSANKETTKDDSKSDENTETSDDQGVAEKMDDDAPGSESKDADVGTAVVVEKVDGGDEDVDIEGDEEVGGGDVVEDGGEVVDDVDDNAEGQPMGEDELAECDLGDEVDDDLTEDEVEDDLILEDTSAPASSGVDEPEDTKEKDGDTATADTKEGPTPSGDAKAKVAAPVKSTENGAEQVAVKQENKGGAGGTPSPRGRAIKRVAGRGRGKAK